jgi:hypothetical protein
MNNWFTNKFNWLQGMFSQSTSTLNTTSVEPQQDNGIELSSMKVPELKALAKELGIKGYYRMNKATLISTLGDTGQN